MTFSDVTMSEGARWFPKQSVSLTEGLSVKENTWMNLPMTGGWLGGRWEGGRKANDWGGGVNKVHCGD